MIGVIQNRGYVSIGFFRVCDVMDSIYVFETYRAGSNPARRTILAPASFIARKSPTKVGDNYIPRPSGNLRARGGTADTQA